MPPAAARPSYIAFVTRAQRTAVDAVWLGSAETLDDLVTAWRAQVSGIALAGASAAAAEAASRVAGERLRRQFWDPVAARLHDASLIFIVPDGALNLVNVAALPLGRDRYLVEEAPVLHYLTTERDLIPSLTHSLGRGLLAVGGPAYDEPPAAGAKAATVAAGPTAVMAPFAAIGPGGIRAGCGGRALHFAALPNTAAEVQEITRLWPAASAEDVIVLTGLNADERTVKKNIAGRRIVHLATHGFFLGSDCQPMAAGTRGVGGLVSTGRSHPSTAENPLLLSGLALARANRRVPAGVDEDDGMLTAEEVAGLDLQSTEWAVLSACETGVGEVKAGEGVVGLRRAFQVAGARTVIMSLWSVGDEATLAWMQALYDARLRRRLDTAQSVRAASLRVLAERRQDGLSTHPFYWAAFVAAGDWH
jgi:CHAT domain-containing protein